MSDENHLFIAVDLGAESGRVVTGRLTEGRLHCEEIHRFATGAQTHDAQTRNASLRWDLAHIQREIEEGLARAAAHQRAGESASVSVDSWAVDYVLLRQGQPLSWWPFHYRDTRTATVFEEVKSRYASEIFAASGIQFLPFNTLYQLLAERESEAEQWENADVFLLIADYFTFHLSGVAGSELTLASTTQLFDPVENQWSEALLQKFEFAASKFAPIVAPGTIVGPLCDALRERTGLRNTSVIATCAHDTGAAVAAVPAQNGADWAFLSSGTWSLLGIELPAPLINRDVLDAGFTNEAGFGGTTRFLKNIVGLWIMQECRRFWQAQGDEFSYDELARLAQAAKPFGALIRPDDARFAAPGEMPLRIADFCRETGQTPPQTPGEFVRCISESLALLYGQTLTLAETLTGRQVARLHVVGGGSQNALLNQFTADATGREVWAGPVEATALGNLGVQALALDKISSLDAWRQIVRATDAPRVFAPQDGALWQRAAARFETLKTS